MTEEPNQPTPASAPAKATLPLGWIWLAIASLVLIASGTFSYISILKDPSLALYEFDEDLKAAVRSQVSAVELGGTILDRQERRGALVKLVNDLAAAEKKDPKLTPILAVASYELDHKVSPAIIGRLAAQPSKSGKALARLYGSNPPPPSDLPKLRDQIKGVLFSQKLAQRHAEIIINKTQSLPPLFSRKATAGAGLLGLAFVLAVPAGIALISWYLLGLRSKSIVPLGFLPQYQNELQSDELARRGAFVLLMFLLVGFVVEEVFDFLKLGSKYSSSVGSILLILVATIILKRDHIGVQLSWGKLGLRKGNLAEDLVWGVGAALASAPIFVASFLLGLLISQVLPQGHHPVQFELLGADPPTVALVLFSAIVLAPIVEEMVFRGLIFGSLLHLIKKPIWAMLACGLLFAMIHPTGPAAWPVLTAMGFLGAAVTYQRGSIVPAIVFHSIHNSFILAVSLLTG